MRPAGATALVLLALAGCHAGPPKTAARVDPADYDQFFLWAGVPPPAGAARAKVLYILGGEIRRGGPARLIDLRAAVPQVRHGAVWLTVRAERLDWDEPTWHAVLAMLKHWRAAGNPLEGLQMDFDAATPGLGRYRAFLAEVRRRLPPREHLSITGLLDWSAHGDPAALAGLAGVVDEVVIQTYQGRSTIPGYTTYFRQIERLPIPHKIALVAGGEWTPPPELARDRRLTGYVVFLVKPPALADRAYLRP